MQAPTMAVPKKANAAMTRLHLHSERHLVSRIGWLRAAVLGANDGIVSTASLIIGVSAAVTKRGDILIADVAGLVAGAMSMAAVEYASVSSQFDTEQADLARERAELSGDVDAEIQELAGIYMKRGVDSATADTVARQLMAKDALAAHAHDELGISEMTTARPIQAALNSAATFTAGAALPLAIVIFAPAPWLVVIEAIASLFIPRAAGCRWRAGGRRAGLDRNGPCHLLGGAGNGADSRDRHAGRSGGMKHREAASPECWYG